MYQRFVRCLRTFRRDTWVKIVLFCILVALFYSVEELIRISIRINEIQEKLNSYKVPKRNFEIDIVQMIKYDIRKLEEQSQNKQNEKNAQSLSARFGERKLVNSNEEEKNLPLSRRPIRLYNYFYLVSNEMNRRELQQILAESKSFKKSYECILYELVNEENSMTETEPKKGN